MSPFLDYMPLIHGALEGVRGALVIVVVVVVVVVVGAVVVERGFVVAEESDSNKHTFLQLD